MENYIEQAADTKNIYLAYLRLKNTIQNEELFLEKEILYFEKDIDQIKGFTKVKAGIEIIDDDKLQNEELSNQILKIRKIILNEVDDYNFNKFDFITKIKKICDDNKISSYRPLTRYRFFDLVIMQSIFNVLFEKLKNFMPKENYGVQLSDNPKYLYKNWANQYKKFIDEQKKHSSKDSLYQYVYEYDIKEFYPSISQKQLVDDISESINLDKNDIFYKWIEKIIYYYNADNISEETKMIFEEYCKVYEGNDKDNHSDEEEQTNEKENMPTRKIDRSELGLPQGPLFSSFLAVFYIRNLYKKFKNEMNKRKVFDFVHFSYIDDGRIYLQDNQIKSVLNDNPNETTKNKITNILNNIFQNLNEESDKKIETTANESLNTKIIQLNDEKIAMLSLDEKSVKNQLDFISSDASLINSSINPRFEIPSDLEDAVIAKHEAIKNKLEDMYKKVGKIEDEDIRNSELEKIEKEYKTYSKRRTNFLTRKISSNSKFYDLVKIIFEDEPKDDENLKDDINNFNYYYNLLNLMRNAENDDNRIQYLVEKVKKYLEEYQKKASINEMIIFYYLATIKAIYQVKYSIFYKNMLDGIKNRFKNNLLVDKYYNSYIDDSWLLEMNSNKAEVKDDEEAKAIDYYIDYPLNLKKNVDVMINHNLLFKNAEINYDDSDIEHIYKYKDTNIIIRGDVENRDISYKKNYKSLNDDELSEFKKMKWLSLLLEFWRKEIDTQKYINPAYLLFENIKVKNKDSQSENGSKENINNCSAESIMIINNNINKTFEYYGIKDEMIDYKEYLKVFFMNFFKCEESIIVNKKGRTLKFWEYRVLSFLHNKIFNRDDFFDLLENITKNYDYLNHEVDTNFEKIRFIVDDNLGSAKDKDVIICLHYYLHCVWKNGSKDLTFFTLHNQEHSIELIQNYMRISPKLLDKFKLEKNENFILFSACYLHDIGMLKGLSKKEMYDLKNLKVLDFYGDVYKYFDEIKIIKMETMLKKIYSIHDKTEQLFENIVRSEHSTRAKNDIIIDDMLPLTDLEKKYISKVSENHGNDYEVVYGLVDNQIFRNRKIDIRKISIWLRLLDLTDISKSRVTQAVFSRYFERMGMESRFHWLKHLCVNNIDFESQFDKSKQKLSVKILINMNYLPQDEYLNKKCEYPKDNSKIECFQYKKEDDNKGKEIYIRKENNFECKNCNLLCAFLNENYWFEKEVDQLNWYSKKYCENEIDFTLNYVLDNETKRDKFEIYRFSDTGRKKVSANECIKEYLVKKHKKNKATLR